MTLLNSGFSQDKERAVFHTEESAFLERYNNFLAVMFERLPKIPEILDPETWAELWATDTCRANLMRTVITKHLEVDTDPDVDKVIAELLQRENECEIFH